MSGGNRQIYSVLSRSRQEAADLFCSAAGGNRQIDSVFFCDRRKAADLFCSVLQSAGKGRFVLFCGRWKVQICSVLRLAGKGKSVLFCGRWKPAGLFVSIRIYLCLSQISSFLSPERGFTLLLLLHFLPQGREQYPHFRSHIQTRSWRSRRSFRPYRGGSGEA